MTIDNVIKNQGTLGKLKSVSRVRNSFKCAECGKEVEKGSKAYSQSDYTQKGFFPVQRKICEECGERMISEGTQVKDPKKKKEVKINSQGCGKPTEYPKPNNQGIWMCGEEAPLVGVMLCKECKGK